MYKHCQSFSRTFSSLQPKLYSLNYFLFHIFLIFWQPPFFLVSVITPSLSTLYELNHTLFFLLCLAYFPQHNIQSSPILYVCDIIFPSTSTFLGELYLDTQQSGFTPLFVLKDHSWSSSKMIKETIWYGRIKLISVVFKESALIPKLLL